MKHIVVILSVLLFNSVLYAQNETSQAFETFEYKSGDTTYVMKKYFLCLLYSGDNRGQDEKISTEIQEAHLNHISKLAEVGMLAIAGPMADNTDLRGIFILNVPTLEMAQKLTNDDPAIKAGRLKAEIHPWWAAVGSTLP